MKPPQPSIAVVMAVYNGAATVGRAIDSVLAQQFDGLRLVIVDDGSTDATHALSVAMRHPIPK